MSDGACTRDNTARSTVREEFLPRSLPEDVLTEGWVLARS